MNNLNSVLIEGNLVRDPQMRTTPKGTPLCTFSLASNRYYRQDQQTQEETAFFDVESWSRLADHCFTNGRKGRGVRVVGRLKQSRWTDTDGKAKSRISIVAEHVEFRPDFRPENRGDTSTESAVEEHTRLVAEAASSEQTDAEMPVEEQITEEDMAAVAF